MSNHTKEILLVEDLVVCLEPVSIHDQRFALIISEPLNLIIRGEDYAFGDENDAYVKWVTMPLTCSYEPIYTNYQTGVQLLVPRVGTPPSHIPCDDYIK